MSDLQRNVRRPGDLDITFGNAGTVSLELTRAADVIMFDPTSGNITGAISGNGGFEVFRLLDDGQLDQTFGDNGIAHGRFTTLDTHQRPTSLRLLDDGSLFVAGESNGSAALPTHPAAALFTSDGQPDPSFGTEGSVLITLTPPTHDSPPVPASAAQAAKHLFAYRGTGAAKGRGLIIGLTATGELAPAFAHAGHTWLRYEEAEVIFFGCDVQSDGSIVAVGTAMKQGVVACFDQHGQLKTSFGDAGIKLIEGTDAGLRAVTTGAGDASFCVGWRGTEGMVVALTAQGQYLPDFNQAAPLYIRDSLAVNLKAADMGLDGLLVTGGNVGTRDSGVYRVKPDGVLDGDFGQNGGITRFGLRLSDLAVQADGNIVVVGTDYENTMIKRFLGA
jgi:uncharacterized delta-60 repeat protein